MHKRRPDFDPLKFTPSIIHNKIELDEQSLIQYFQAGNTLGDCAKYFGCSAITIKRRLKSYGIDTSLYNNSNIAKLRSKAKSTENKIIPSDDEIKELYIDYNLDSKTIAERFMLHYQTIRTRIQRMGLKKSRELISRSMMARYQLNHGCSHPAQHPDTLKKTRRSTIRIKYINTNGVIYTFRSLHELSYALYLDTTGIEWVYEEMRIPYIDMLTGKRRIYIIDFTVLGNTVEWIEVKPNEDMIPEDKRIYAMRRAEESGIIYRGTTEQERSKAFELLLSGYRLEFIEFIYPIPRCDQNKITYWFKSKTDASNFMMDGWKEFKVTNEGVIYKKIMVRI